MAAILSNGKGFYSTLVYALECYNLGLYFLHPSINHSSDHFEANGTQIRVPLRIIKGISAATIERHQQELQRSSFASLRDFCDRVHPSTDEVESLIRSGAFDEFGNARARLFWQSRAFLASGSRQDSQQWLLPPPNVSERLTAPLQEPSLKERLEWESDLFGFTISGHPLDLFPDVAWDTYLPCRTPRRLHRPASRLLRPGHRAKTPSPGNR